MATNAVKHGALSNARGRVELIGGSHDRLMPEGSG
jgi:two-component sensor histidine kinase